MLHFQINPQSHVPAYRQLMDQVKFYVASGAMKPGDQLPSIRELARLLSVNPTTVVKAYSELGHEKVIEMQHGRGVFVADGPTGRLSEAERESALRPLARQLAIEARQLGASRDLIARLLDEAIREIQPVENDDE